MRIFSTFGGAGLDDQEAEMTLLTSSSNRSYPREESSVGPCHYAPTAITKVDRKEK